MKSAGKREGEREHCRVQRHSYWLRAPGLTNRSRAFWAGTLLPLIQRKLMLKDEPPECINATSSRHLLAYAHASQNFKAIAIPTLSTKHIHIITAEQTCALTPSVLSAPLETTAMQCSRNRLTAYIKKHCIPFKPFINTSKTAERARRINGVTHCGRRWPGPPSSCLQIYPNMLRTQENAI